ncbi:MAG: thiolase family protein [Proteobacteria bacterium]|nr:thiolase family protein [Pseudomonadota bacterium]
MADVYIIGSYSTRFQKWPDKSFKDLTREAYLGVLGDSGLENGADIEITYFGNCGLGTWGQSCIRGQVCFTPLVREGLFPERVPTVNVEDACATSAVAMNGAWKDILSGQSHLALAMGVEKTYVPGDPARTMELFAGGVDQLDPQEWQAHYRQQGEAAGKPFETGPGRTIFMDTYAMQASHHMRKWGTTREQIATGAAKNHNNGALNPLAQYQFEMSVDEVLADREVSHPLTRAMCAPVGDGAAAAILCSEDYLRNLPGKVQGRAVKVKASALSGGKYRSLEEPGLTKIAADKAYAMAGVTPADIDVAEVHDATSFCEIYQVEMMGFCGIGEGGKFIGDGHTMLDGKIPVNTSGGLVSKGHPVGATGLSMIHELTVQLRGEAGARQVAGARLALAENGGGVMGMEEAAACITILEKDT